MRSIYLTAFFWILGKIMKRNYPANTSNIKLNQSLTKQIAYHEAGHAAAIYLNNKKKNLPPIYFQIRIKELNSPDNIIEVQTLKSESSMAMIEGGRLIQSLPLTLLESACFYSADQLDAFKAAFEADIINLLVGPLAEAKQVALYNHSRFNTENITLETLHTYGGSSDLKTVHEYLSSFIADRHFYNETLTKLFSEALDFINTPSHWCAIERLATYILSHDDDIISCEDVITLIDTH